MRALPFHVKVKKLLKDHNEFVQRPNTPIGSKDGLFIRYENPVLTHEHTPVFWRFDLSEERNPHLVQRLGINSVFNAGAIYLNNTFYVMARVEGYDRKSFFAVAESQTGVDQFTFWDYPITMPINDEAETNVYDMRLTQHEDGWIYGVFCSEQKDPNAPDGDTSSAIAAAGIARTKDLNTWERLPDLKTNSNQQRNVVLHPEFIDNKYAFYTRPQDDFIFAGSGGGIGWGLSESMNPAVIEAETVVQPRTYHTIYELKNGLGPAPIKTEEGWLQLAHGVRNTAAGLRYVLYIFMTDLEHPEKITHMPGGYCLAPIDDERVGDVSNVLFSNGWISLDTGEVYIYYGSSDTRLHVAVSSIDRLIDYVKNTPQDPLRSAGCVQQRNQLIKQNLDILKEMRLR